MYDHQFYNLHLNSRDILRKQHHMQYRRDKNTKKPFEDTFKTQLLEHTISLTEMTKIDCKNIEV